MQLKALFGAHNMTTLVAIALTTGLLSGIWGWLSISLGLLTWAGFLGCATYFSAPGDGFKVVWGSIATNLSGVFWAILIMQISNIINIEIIGYIILAVIVFLMCMQASQSLLSFIPGTFIGSCATFAAHGNWQIVVPSLLLGVIFGYLMKSSGLWLQKLCQEKITNNFELK